MSDKYKIIQCNKCKGIGLIKREVPLTCECNKVYTRGCYKCEHIKLKGSWIECCECLGIGSHWINKITNKKTLVWCLSK